ncbi:F-box/kelch-repeat protein At3g06240-like [Cicer arietinum]|uniref:F-box/kelch-repeat protein At3g06240-like n=1 Tax=Cicer arietinum TaxID=3827 RepID=A0A1S2YTY3_CICAR|nr:F-box/kelch-repeat protein At3g06240-like [Cicer arietinum]
MASTSEKKVSSYYIPDDIAFSILSKLPIKSLKRFFCVRKSWSLLFENPNFIYMFHNNFLSKSHSLYDDVSIILNQFASPDFHWNLYLLSGEKLESKVKLDFPPPFHIQQNGVTLTRILSSAINGILCIYDCDNHTKAILWNPATKEIKVIPPSLGEFSPEFRTVFTLHGFGYDHVSDDYKVIQHVSYFVFDGGPWDNVIPDPFWEIYSLKRNSWRKLEFFTQPRYYDIDTEVYLNGVCHWLGKTIDKTHVVSFDLCNEVFFFTPSPLEDVHDDFDVHLVGLNGNVAMISNYKNTSSFHISILGELGVKESWIRLFDVGPLSSIDHPIGTGKKGNIFFRKENDELVCLDLTTGVIEEIGFKGEKLWCQMVVYKENLRPIR